jgi:hypothetical protein
MADPLSSLVGPQPITDLAQSAPYNMSSISGPQQKTAPISDDLPESLRSTSVGQQIFRAIISEPNWKTFFADLDRSTPQKELDQSGFDHFENKYGRGAADRLRNYMGELGRGITPDDKKWITSKFGKDGLRAVETLQKYSNGELPEDDEGLTNKRDADLVDHLISPNASSWNLVAPDQKQHQAKDWLEMQAQIKNDLKGAKPEESGWIMQHYLSLWRKKWGDLPGIEEDQVDPKGRGQMPYGGAGDISIYQYLKNLEKSMGDAVDRSGGDEFEIKRQQRPKKPQNI